MHSLQKLHKLEGRLERLNLIRKSLISQNGSIAHIRCIYDNLGDIAVAKAINALFTKVRLIDYSYNSKVKILEKLLKKNLFKYVCLGGGTLIFAPQDIGWFLSLKDAMSRKPDLLFTFGTGVRDPEFFKDASDADIFEWCNYLKKFKLISVRGNLSARILKNRGIDNVNVIGDPALIFSREHIRPKKHLKKIGINISNNYHSYGDNQEKVFAILKSLIRDLAKDGWKATLFPTCDEEIALSENIVKEMKYRNVKLHKNYWDINSYLAALEEQDVFIGIKLHSVILAFCAYTPSLMLAYQPKCYDFMETMDMNEFISRSDSLETPVLRDRIYNLYNNIEEIQKKQYRACQHFRQRIVSFRDEVYKLLEDGNGHFTGF